MTAAVCHGLLGLWWLLVLWFAAVDLDGTRTAIVWVGSAAILWLVFGRSVLTGPRPWRDTFLWWAASLVAPISLIFVAVAWWRPSAQEVDMSPDSPVVARLDQAERRLRSLERELADLRRLVAPPAPIRPEPAPAPPSRAAAERVRGSEPPGPPARPVVPPVRERAPRPRRSLADLLDGRALAVAGGVVTLLGVVFLFVLAVNRGWIGPTERVLAGAFVSGLLVAAGFVARRRYGQLDAALAAVGAGLAGGYATLLAATARYDLVDQGAALVLAAGIATVGTLIALAWSAEILAGIGLVGAALAPAAVGIEGGIEVLGTAFAALVFAAIAVVALRRDWTWLLVAGVVATAPQWAALLVAEHDSSAGGAVVVAALLVALYLATGVLRSLLAKRLEWLSSALVPLSAWLGVCSALALLDDPSVWLLVLALPFAALAAALFARARDLSALLAAAAMVVSALAFADLLGGLGLTVAWALQAAAFAWLARRTAEPRFATASVGYLLLAVGHALAVEAPPADLYTAGSDPAAGIPALLVVAGAAAVVARWARGWSGPDGGGRLARLFGFVVRWRAWVTGSAAAAAALAVVDAVSLAVLALVDAAGVEPAFDWGRVGIVALWSALGAVLFAAGTWARSRNVAAAGIVWLGVTAFDLVAFDLVQLGDSQTAWAAAALSARLRAGAYADVLAPDRLEPVTTPVAIAAFVGSSGFAAFAVRRFFEGDDSQGLAPLALAAGYGVLASFLFGRDGRRDATTALWAISGVCVLVAQVLLLEDTALVAAATLFAVALGALVGATGERRFALAALVPLALATGVTVVELAPPGDFFVANASPGDGALAAALVAAALAALALLVRVPPTEQADELDRVLDEAIPLGRATASWLAAATGVYAGSLAILGITLAAGDADLTTEFQRGHTTVSAFWGIVALVALYAGLRRDVPALRLAGFALFGAALAKLFFYDLSELSSVTRALSFLAVGAVLLLGGFFYQRLAGPRNGGPRPA